MVNAPEARLAVSYTPPAAQFAADAQAMPQKPAVPSPSARPGSRTGDQLPLASLTKTAGPRLVAFTVLLRRDAPPTLQLPAVGQARTSGRMEVTFLPLKVRPVMPGISVAFPQAPWTTGAMARSEE